jgi:drug/metabolite transporter (DMT)-like permease
VSVLPRLRSFLSFEALLAMILWGVSFVATSIALRAFHPFGLVATRLALGAALLALVQVVRRQPVLPERGDRLACAALGVVLAVHLLLQAFGLRHTTAIRTGWIIAFIPIMIALGGSLFLARHLAPLGWLGVALGSTGVLVVAAVEPRDFANARFGDLLQLASCVTWTAYTLTAHRPAERSGAVRTTVLAMGLAAALAAAAAASTGVFVAAPTVGQDRRDAVLPAVRHARRGPGRAGRAGDRQRAAGRSDRARRRVAGRQRPRARQGRGNGGRRRS